MAKQVIIGEVQGERRKESLLTSLPCCCWDGDMFFLLLCSSCCCQRQRACFKMGVRLLPHSNSRGVWNSTTHHPPKIGPKRTEPGRELLYVLSCTSMMVQVPGAKIGTNWLQLLVQILASVHSLAVYCAKAVLVGSTIIDILAPSPGRWLGPWLVGPGAIPPSNCSDCDWHIGRVDRCRFS